MIFGRAFGGVSIFATGFGISGVGGVFTTGFLIAAAGGVSGTALFFSGSETMSTRIAFSIGSEADGKKTTRNTSTATTARCAATE